MNLWLIGHYSPISQELEPLIHVCFTFFTDLRVRSYYHYEKCKNVYILNFLEYVHDDSHTIPVYFILPYIKAGTYHLQFVR